MDIRDWTTTEIDTFVFAHPRSWSVDIERNEEGTCAYLQSPAVSFGVVGVYPHDREPEDIAEQVLESVREEHPGLELESQDIDVKRFPSGISWEAMFMTLDTVAYFWVRSWRDGNRSLVVFVQCVEPESGESEEVFQGICQSVLPGSARSQKE